MPSTSGGHRSTASLGDPGMAKEAAYGHAFDGGNGLGEGPHNTPLLTKTVMTPFDNRREVRYEGNGTIAGSIFTLANSAIGSGVLAFPFAMKKMGLTLGIIVCIVAALIMGACLHFTVYACDRAQQRDSRIRSFQDLAAAAGGKRAGALLEVMLLLYLFGCCTGFLIVCSDMIVPMLQANNVTSLGSDPRTVIIVVVGCCFCLPLCLLRRISALRFSSVFAVCAVTYMVLTLIVEYCKVKGDSTDAAQSKVPGAEPGHVEQVEANADMLAALPLIAFAFQCHIQAPLIYTELKSSVRTVPNMDRVCVGAYGLCLILYLPAGIFGYLTFGDNTLADVVTYSKGQNIGYLESDTLVDVARICIACTAICGFPLNHFPARTALWGIYQRYRDDRAHSVGMDKTPTKWLATEAMIWCFACILLACVVKNLGVVFGLVGSICGSLVIFFFPAFFWWRYGPDSVAVRKGGAIFTFLFGSIVFVMGTLTTLNVV